MDQEKQANARWAEWGTYAALLAAPWLFFWRETLGGATLGDQDAVFWFYPAYKFVAEQLRHGHLPLWTPYLYAGAPLLAEWQAGAFDPLNWLHLLGASSRTLTTSLQLTFSLALCATFSYGRAIGFTRRAAIVSAGIYAFGGFLVGRTLYPGFLHIVALAPLVLTFTERLAARGRRRDVVFGAAVVAWQVFAAHPQPLIYSSLLACAYALFRAFSLVEPPRRLRYLVQFALLFLAGASLSAAQLFPAAEFARDSVRREWPFELFTLHSLHPASLLTQLFPFFHGAGQSIYRMPYWGPYWHHNEAQIYLGALALALAGAAMIAALRTRNPLMRFWSAVAVAGTLLAMGKYAGPLARLLFHVPVLGQFRSPNRHWMEVSLAVAVLAGYAVDGMLREEALDLARAARWASAGIAALGGVVGGFVLWRPTVAEAWLRRLPDLDRMPPGFLQAAGAELWLPMALASAAFVVVWSFTRWRLYWILPAFLFVDYSLYAGFAPIRNPARLETLVGRAMPESLANAQSELAPIRYHVMLNTVSGEFSPFWFYGHEMTTGYDPILNEPVKTFLGIDEAGRTFNATMLESQDRTLDLLNARYVLVAPVFFDSGAAKVAEGSLDTELRRGRSADFSVREGAGDALTIVSSLSNSASIPDGEPVAEITVTCAEKRWKTALRAGQETAEWAYDRPDVRRAIRHARPPIAESWSGDVAASFQAHAYRARLPLPPDLSACRASRSVHFDVSAREDISLSLRRIAFEDSVTKQSLPLVRTADALLGDATRWEPLDARSPAAPYRDFRIYRNLRAQPRAWLVPRAQVAWAGDQLKMIRGELPGFDPTAAALVEPSVAAQLPPALLNEASPQGAGDAASRRVAFETRGATWMRLRTESETDSILVLSEIDYPGWRVRVDGNEAPVLRVDYRLRGVALRPGTHRIEMVYRPRSFWAGVALSIGMALLLVAALTPNPLSRRERGLPITAPSPSGRGGWG